MKKYKTKNNLQEVWNDLDKAYECLERALENLVRMSGLDKELVEDVEDFDISLISSMMNLVEEEVQKQGKELTF